ncbi:MAG: hypothetical protein ACK4Z8_05015 [Novosphingobium sp.]
MPLGEAMKAEGWIEHDGGECPVADDAYVSIMFKNMMPTSFAPADCFEWSAVRTYKPETDHG